VGGKRLNEASSWLTAAIHEVHLLASDGASGDIFGSSVAVSGDTAVVGARSDDTSARFAGSAYVFVRSGGLTSQQAHLFASDGAYSDAFGVSVAVSGDTAVVGAWLDDTSAGANAGSVDQARRLA